MFQYIGYNCICKVFTDYFPLWIENARSAGPTIGYYATREEAMIALATYNENPYDIKADSITFSEVYEIWSEGYFPTLSNPSSIRTIKAAYSYCNGLIKTMLP